MITEAIAACARIVEKGDPWRFRTVMAAPLAARSVLFPIYAFNVEVSRAPWVTQEAMIAEMRLQWWRDALEEIATGGEVRRHEVVTPLSDVIDPADARLLDAAVAARRWDIYRDPFEDTDHFETYIDQTAGHVMWVSARHLGAEDEAGTRALAFAGGLASFLRAVPELERAGRIPLLDGTRAGLVTLATRGLEAAVQRPRRLCPAHWTAAGSARFLSQIKAKPQRVSDNQMPQTGGAWALAKASLLGRL